MRFARAELSHGDLKMHEERRTGQTTRGSNRRMPLDGLWTFEWMEVLGGFEGVHPRMKSRFDWSPADRVN